MTLLAYSKPRLILLEDNNNFLTIFKDLLSNEIGCEVVINEFTNGHDFECFYKEHCCVVDSVEELLLDFYNKKESLEVTLNMISSLPAIYILDQNLKESTYGSDYAKEIKALTGNLSNIFLLTSELTNEEGIEHHNNRSIDFFIKKDRDNLIPYVVEKIKTLIKDRKSNFSSSVDELAIFKDLAVITSDKYIKNINNLCTEYQLLSYIVKNTAGDIGGINHNNEYLNFTYDQKQNKLKII